MLIVLPLIVAGALADAGPSDLASRLAVIRKAPDFTLVTQEGTRLRFADLRGKVALVSFIFTTCNGTCPATTHRMAQVQEELRRRGRMDEGSVRLLSITLDPARDPPEVLRQYMKLYDADPTSWTFLTGPPAEVAAVIKAWEMWVKPLPNGQFDHPSRVFLVDRHGRVREIYNLSFLKPAGVAEDIASLLSEQK